MKLDHGWILLGTVLLPIGLTAQGIAAGGGHVHEMNTYVSSLRDLANGAEGQLELSEMARAQIDTVRTSALALGIPAAARGAGFRPALGMIPTMGTHWVGRRGMITPDAFDLTRPQHLMFAPIDGVETLVGVAFAYQAQSGEDRPDAFEGDLDQWHVHPELSPPGRELTMLHVWFVPSPDGPFVGHNPWLPYFATGLELPDLSRLTDEADSYRIRALALVLAETVSTPFSLDRFQERLPEWFNLPDLETHRDAIREQIPDLDAASRIGNLDGWNAAADRPVAEWEAIRSSYLATIPIPALRGRLSEVYDEMLAGAHEKHGSQ